MGLPVRRSGVGFINPDLFNTLVRSIDVDPKLDQLMIAPALIAPIPTATTKATATEQSTEPAGMSTTTKVAIAGGLSLVAVYLLTRGS